MGSGTDSLVELCITSERSQNGSSGVVALFAKSHQNPGPVRPWSPELLQAANAALSEHNPAFTPTYMMGLKAMFSPGSTWAPLALELLGGMADTVSLELLVDIYERARQNRGIAPELKTALRSTILRSINLSVGGILEHALPELNDRKKLDPITPKVVASTQKIALALSQGLPPPWYEVNKLKRYLGALPTEVVPLTAVNTSAALPLTPAAVSPISQDVESTIKKLAGESLRTYLQQTIGPNLSDSASEIYVDFRNALDRISIKALITLRPALASLDTVPAIFTQTVERRIQEELSTTLPKLAAVPLAELYERCVQLSAPQEDIRIVLNALRARLRLPPPSEEGVTHDVSIAGLFVWRSIFSDIPPDGALLSDIVRVHFSAIMTHIARSFSPHNTPGSALDATLRYGEELGILSSYVPNKRLHDVPLWKVIFFTALVRAQIGEKGGVVDTLTREITSRLTTTEAQAVDGFPPQWARNAGSASIVDVCSEIASSILKSSPPPSFDELSLLLTNARLFERKGPSHINRLYEQLRQRFIHAIRRIDPSELRGKDNHSLRRFTQALAAARYRSVALLEVISDECVRRADSFSTTEFNTEASALATVRGGSPEFWSKFAERVDQEWLSYGDEISTVPIWSLVVGDPEKVHPGSIR